MAESLSPEVQDKVDATYVDLLEAITSAGGDPTYFQQEYMKRIPAHDLIIILARNGIKFTKEV
jgi:hypothetical protein